MKVRHFRWLFAATSTALWIAAIAMSGEPAILGMSAEWSDGRYRFAGGIEFRALGVVVLIAALYLLLMNVTPSVMGRPLSGVFRRFIAFWLDFVLAMSIIAPVLGIVPVVFEWRRTGLFAWTFERTTPAASDLPIAALSAVLAFAGLLYYYAIPISRGRPSPGACIMGYQVVREGGGRLTLERALLRTLLGFIAVCGAWAAPFIGRDQRHGKFWLDRVFGTQATLLE